MNILIDRPLMRLPDGSAEAFARSDASLYALEWNAPLDVFQRIGGDDYGNRNASCTQKRNRTRDVFLAGDYDALLCFDSDIIAPPDALKRLVALDCDIAYGLYVNRPWPHQWCAAVLLAEQRWQSLSSLPSAARESWGQPFEVKGVGFGFTLIRRHVIEAAPFRDWKNVSCDWGLAYDAQRNGWSQVMDLGCVLGHIKRDGAVLWPDPDAPGLIRTEAS
jgi:hypothetical protein